MRGGGTLKEQINANTMDDERVEDLNRSLWIFEIHLLCLVFERSGSEIEDGVKGKVEKLKAVQEREKKKMV
ncbi:hypothetical protein SOVF_191070 [Spinacia oleracea]|nr:hypothetical protein SOVF_191070 [Spinacia oleracea]